MGAARQENAAMTDFPIHTAATAPDASRPILEGVQKAWNFTPNLHAVLAEAPAALEGYSTLFGIFDKTSFSPAERQVVYLTANYENECEYCMAGHSVLGRMAGLPPEVIEALREGGIAPDARLEALHRFTGLVVRERGHVAPAEVDAFIAVGFTRQQVLEVVLGVAVKTMSNYTNHLAHTPNDAFMANTAWVAPSRRARAAE
jgi:AhpD family alkylhydroperoxidase